MLQDCGSTRTIRANALYKWKGLTLSLRADPNLTYFRFRNCYGCRPLSCSNGRKWTCGRSVNLHIRKTKCPTALAAPCARVVWIPHFHPMAFVPNAEHKCLVPCCRDPVGTEQRSCLVSHPRLGGPHLGGGLIYCRGNYPSPWERGRLSQPAPHLWRGSA
jgi:hypothetical protein